MRWILGAAAVTALVGLSATAQAGERPGPVGDVPEVIQAGKCCKSKYGNCGSGCGSCCGDPRIGHAIETLMCGERVCDRRKATNVLEKYNWTQHPEIVAALEYAMQSDPDPRVRWDAADALKDMKVSDPDAIGAMQFTRSADPSCRTRYKAKWGVIVGQKSQPPMLNYVSGYGEVHEARSEYEPQRAAPKLEIPKPEQKNDLDLRRRDLQEPVEEKQTSKSGVRSFMSNALARVRPRS